MSTSTTSVSRRSFLAGAAATTVGALSTGVALADSVPPDDAMEKAKAVGTSSDAHGIPSTDEYVIDITKGVPKWGFEIAPEPIADDQIAETVEDDIIVIGAGMAGMCVAAAAAEQGAGVTLFAASSQPLSLIHICAPFGVAGCGWDGWFTDVHTGREVGWRRADETRAALGVSPIEIGHTLEPDLALRDIGSDKSGPRA